MALTSLDPHAFPLPEPYFSHETVRKYAPELVVSGAFDVPYPSEFFDCSFARSEWLIKATFWTFACSNVKWIQQDQALFDACNHSKLSSPLVRERCLSSSVIVLKILRLPWVMQHLDSSRIFSSDVRIIHVVRHPGAVLRSRYAANWLVIRNTTLIEEAEDLCHDMSTTTLFLRRVHPTQHLLVKYEDLLSNFDQTFRRISEFTSTTLDDDLLKAAERVRTTKHADIPQYEMQASLPTFKALVSAIPECGKAIRMLDYDLVSEQEL